MLAKIKETKTTNRNSAMQEKGFRCLFEDELRDILWAEKALTKAMPKMIKHAQSPELINAISEHLDTTIAQVARLEKVFSILGLKPIPKRCAAIEGLIKESEDIMENNEEGIIRDAGIISAARKVEHYEIASYGTLCAFAETLRETEVVALLEKTLKEEKDAEDILIYIAKSAINIETYYDYMEYEYIAYEPENRKTA